MKDFFDNLENKPKPNLLKRSALWWKFDGRYYFKYFKQGVKNIIYWIPIIWRDRNWDHTYIFTILQHKLKAQAKCIANNNRHTTALYDAKRIELCVNLIEKIQDGFYETEYMNYAKDRHWFEPCNDGTTNSTWESENIWEEYDQYFKKYPNTYRKVINGKGFAPIKGREDDKHFIAMSIGHMNHSKANKLLFQIIEKNIHSWWD